MDMLMLIVIIALVLLVYLTFVALCVGAVFFAVGSLFSPRIRAIWEAEGEWERATLNGFVVRLFAVDFRVFTKIAKKIIINTDGYVSFGRQIATEAAESNAPPTAPPIDDVFNILQSLLPAIFDELIDTKIKHYQPLRRPEIQKYCFDKIVQKAYNYPHLIPLTFSIDGIFQQFEKAVKGEISNLIENIIRPNEGTDRQEPCIVAARRALYRREYSMDAPLPSADGGKITTLHDIVAGGCPDPLTILLAAEQSAAEQAALDALSDTEKAAIIQGFDADRRAAKGLLFNIITGGGHDDDDYPAPPRIKPKRRRKAAQPQQLGLFVGGAI